VKRHITLAIIVCGLAVSSLGADRRQAAPSQAATPHLNSARDRAEGRLSLSSSNAQLLAAFDWARRQALAYAFDRGDPVGPWFEAALPGREAFCMRDVSHQAMGAHALGLQRHTFNMLRRFAAAITEERDWCGLWEIDRHGRPAHADYRNDRDFWYNLPANFDILDATYRMFLWTGNQDYLSDPAFRAFADRTVTDYVTRWRLAPEQVMSRPRLMNVRDQGDPDAQFTRARGIPGYNEGTEDFAVGLDLLATQYAGYHAYARLLEARGDRPGARAWLARAGEVKSLVSRTWWDEARGEYYDRVGTDGVLKTRATDFRRVAELYWPVTEPGVRTRRSVDRLLAQIKADPSGPIEEQSHHPEVLYRYGEPRAAYGQVLDLTRPDRSRREYPEVSFAVVGAIVTGMFGISVDPVTPGRESELLDYFANQFVATLPQLTPETPWAELSHLPVRGNDITVRHDGNSGSMLTNNSGPALIWRAMLPGRHATLRVNGVAAKATVLKLPIEREVSFVRLVVPPGGSARVETATDSR
jgi:hypothetical protein